MWNFLIYKNNETQQENVNIKKREGNVEINIFARNLFVKAIEIEGPRLLDMKCTWGNNE